MSKIVLIGASGHAKVIVDILEKEKKHEIIGYIDSGKKIGESMLGYKIIANQFDSRELYGLYGKFSGIIAVGDNFTRYKIAQSIKAIEPDFHFSSAIHPSANLGCNSKIGNGTVVMAGTSINTDAVIGDFCIVNTNASIDHDVVMKNYSSVAPNASLGGNVYVGEFVAIGIGATVIHGVEIGMHAVIAAGSVVISKVPENAVVMGVPAKMSRLRQVGEKYLW